MKKELPNITVVCVACTKVGEAVASIYKTLKQIKPARTILFTNEKLITKDFEVVKIEKLDWNGYNTFICKELYKHFDTDFCLIVQHDSWVLNADCWSDEFLNYDLVAARWLDVDRPLLIGNGGFKLVSKRLQTILGTDPNIKITVPEDVAVSKVYWHYLTETYGIKFAPEEVADRFSFELNEPTDYTFGFHGFHHQPYKETVVFKRSHAMGDVIMAEPLLEYYYRKGYRVAIDCNTELYQIYQQHYFPVYFKENLNPKIKYREIDLNMAYENKPKQSVLQSYYEAAEVKNEPLRNSRLNIYAGGDEQFFKKYVVLHIDKSIGMPYRDEHGVDWKEVVRYLKSNGYEVFQIGKGVSEDVATRFNTMTIQLLMVFIKGADLFIGMDSGAAQIAVGFNVPSVIMFGSVNPELRYTNFERIRVVQSACPDETKKHCYHEKEGRVIGSECSFDKYIPPCTKYTAANIINKINELL